jgi:hypothetical protein
MIRTFFSTAGGLSVAPLPHYLLHSRRMEPITRSTEVQNAASVMGQNEKHVKNLEADRGDGEKIDGDQLVGMVLEEGAPSLRRRFVAAHHVIADGALSDVDAKFEQFAMDAGCTPAGILPAHLADQMSNLMRSDRASRLATAHLPGPEQAEASAMPRYDRFRPDDGQR